MSIITVSCIYTQNDMYMLECNIESVDSTYRNVWTCNYVHNTVVQNLIFKKISFILILLSWPTRIPLARKNMTNVPNHKVAKWPKSFFPSPFLFIFRWLAQNCLNLSLWFLQDKEQCIIPPLFTTWKSHKVVLSTHLRNMASFGTPFSSVVCMHNEMKQRNVLRMSSRIKFWGMWACLANFY